MNHLAWILGAVVCSAVALPAQAQSRGGVPYSAAGAAYRTEHYAAVQRVYDRQAAAAQRYQASRAYHPLPAGTGVHGSGVDPRDVHGRVVYNGPGGGRYTQRQVNRALGTSRRGGEVPGGGEGGE